MKKTFNSMSGALKEIASHFDAESNRQKLALLEAISESKIPHTKHLTTYFETLLFMMAFSSDKKTIKSAEREVRRISAYLKKQNKKVNELFVNSGIPFTKYRSAYSHDSTRWLLSHRDCTIHIHEIENTLFDLNEALKVTLPAQERSETTGGLSNKDLLNELEPDKKKQLQYIINELSRFDSQPYVKDHYYEGLGIRTDIVPKNKLFSKAYNKIDIPAFFYHNEIIKQFDLRALLDRKIPEAATLTESEKKNVIQVIKNAMALTDRETDPATYLKEDTLRLYHLERGLSVALYGMPPERQLPMESYIGYTLFKNGYPAAYAGGWVFGGRSDYGLNIYDHLRGGESAYMVAQILRLYRQVFNLNYFLVEATQFGLDSPEGISTGVFWFYYKLGFRPVDAGLFKLAQNEYRKIKTIKGYRSSEKILLKFTEGNIFLNLGDDVQPGVYDITGKIKEMIIKKYKSNSQRAEQECITEFLKKTGCNDSFNNEETGVLKEVALWASAMNIVDNKKLNHLLRIVKLKPVDEYKCQEQVRKFFEN